MNFSRSAKHSALLGSVLAVAAVSQVQALPVTIDVVGANWTDVVGGAGTLNYVNSDGIAGNEEIRWGDAAEQSGYRFDGAAPPAMTVQTDTTFSLGTFTHYNYPIVSGTSITSAKLNITANLVVDGQAVGEGPFSFSFLHDETTNGCDCPDDNDIVSFSNLAASDYFTVNGVDYTLTLEGFFANGEQTDEFSTVENQLNEASLLASFSAIVPTGPTGEVPEPGSIALFGLGMAALGAARRKR